MYIDWNTTKDCPKRFIFEREVTGEPETVDLASISELDFDRMWATARMNFRTCWKCGRGELCASSYSSSYTRDAAQHIPGLSNNRYAIDQNWIYAGNTHQVYCTECKACVVKIPFGEQMKFFGADIW